MKVEVDFNEVYNKLQNQKKRNLTITVPISLLAEMKEVLPKGMTFSKAFQVMGEELVRQYKRGKIERLMKGIEI